MKTRTEGRTHEGAVNTQVPPPPPLRGQDAATLRAMRSSALQVAMRPQAHLSPRNAETADPGHVPGEALLQLDRRRIQLQVHRQTSLRGKMRTVAKFFIRR